jgi:hypothetical protein
MLQEITSYTVQQYTQFALGGQLDFGDLPTAEEWRRKIGQPIQRRTSRVLLGIY